jgi:hypothetical protein
MNYILSDIIKEIISEKVKNPHLNKEIGDLEKIKSLKNSIEKKIKNAYLEVTGKELDLPTIEIKIDDNIIDGKIAGFDHPSKGKNGMMGIKSKALDDIEYLKWVITHELIHAAVGKNISHSKEHGGLFDKIADELGLPKKYRD